MEGSYAGYESRDARYGSQAAGKMSYLRHGLALGSGDLPRRDRSSGALYVRSRDILFLVELDWRLSDLSDGFLQLSVCADPTV